MGDQLQGQQPVFYDAGTGQYYTDGSMQGRNFMPYMLNSMMGNYRGNRNYLNNFNQSPAMQPQAPYEYADTSLASLFPMLQGAMQGSQGNAMQSDASLLGSQGATSQASSGAGRFM